MNALVVESVEQVVAFRVARIFAGIVRRRKRSVRTQLTPERKSAGYKKVIGANNYLLECVLKPSVIPLQPTEL